MARILSTATKIWICPRRATSRVKDTCYAFTSRYFCRRFCFVLGLLSMMLWFRERFSRYLIYHSSPSTRSKKPPTPLLSSPLPNLRACWTYTASHVAGFFRFIFELFLENWK